MEQVSKFPKNLEYNFKTIDANLKDVLVYPLSQEQQNIANWLYNISDNISVINKSKQVANQIVQRCKQDKNNEVSMSAISDLHPSLNLFNNYSTYQQTKNKRILSDNKPVLLCINALSCDTSLFPILAFGIDLDDAIHDYKDSILAIYNDGITQHQLLISEQDAKNSPPTVVTFTDKEGEIKINWKFL